jgi:Domain of unknown function (DUF4149)
MAAWKTRAARLLPALWLGILIAVVGIATPAPFAVLAQADAGRVVARVLANEAYLSLAFGAAALVIANVQARNGTSRFNGNMMLALAALFCTIVGYFVLQPMMVPARSGQGPLSFGQLHAASGGFFMVKMIVVAALTWRSAT